ncbi:transglycosylase domain-containing protein [Frigidibacter sp. ROC022]|uniref:transglycosylase domain-containing protein n=1 Tax=Frigidibacter sp. ROC022 TaxID=2971796 RepID=UPI00215A4FBE|nr:transglycosylase domain-containing protein [Frigidibacter sp. ROC022]MCR8724870.1 penicillin-binding protein [Frigidibacter sp. ROC022]
MSTNGKGRGRLVADKRYTKPAAAKKAPPKKAAPARRRRRPAPRKRSGGILGLFAALFRWVFGLIWKIAWRSTVVVAMIVGLAVFYFYSTLPPASSLLDARVRGSVTLLDRDGKVFAWRGDQYGGTVSADSVSKYLKNAVIATEDRRFYKHFGVSPRGIASAIRINLREGRGPLSGNGGSTITQQVAKLLCIGVEYDPKKWKNEAAYEADCRESSLWRKMKEAVYALAMEAKYSKDEILTIYLNRAYLGAGSRGFEAASERYFGKPASQVNPAEAAMLAGLLTAPSRFAPTNNLQRSQNRAKVIVGLMEEQGYLTKAEADEARAHPAELSPAAEARAGGYFADWVMDTAPSFLTRDTTEDVELYTTFDPRIQQAAEEALTWVFDNKVKKGSEAQAAIVVMSADGAVRAMVGGRKLKGVAGQFNRAIQAKRQTGSSFKPFVYAAALDQGYSPNDIVVDEPLTIDIKGSGPWSPQNYCHCFKGPMTLTEALMHSENIPAIKIAREVGLENVRKIASDFGIQSDLASGPALALGVSESTLIEMTGAYAGILNGGSSVKPFGLIELKIKGDDVALMGQEGGLGERVITEKAAQQLIYMMNQVIEHGTGRRAKLDDRQAAGKTGTTQAARDAWFMGFTADYVAGVWMGYDDNRPLTGVTGSGLPAEIWRETMTRVHEGLPARPLPMLVPSPADAPRETPDDQIAPPPVDDEADRILLDVIGNIVNGN